MWSSTFPKRLQVGLYQLSPFICTCRSASALRQSQKTEQSTIDEDDVKHYSKLASRWWNEKNDMKGLHALNKLRVQFIRDGLFNVGQIDLIKWQSPQPLHAMKILEVGCGGGILTEPLARLGAEMTGIDASQNMIDAAHMHACQDPAISNSINYICETVEEHINEHTDFYDAVVASEVLEHITHKDLFVKACVSALKPGGSIFITSPNRTIAMWAAGIIMAEYVLRLVPKGTHDLNKCIKPHETQALIEKYGCTTKLIHGMLYNFLSNEWFWSSNTSLNYALHAVRKLH